MVRKTACLLCVLLCLGLLPGSALATDPRFSPGASGVGDAYFPLAGNGGYDAQHYLLDLTYDPPTNHLSGAATITARATQNLSRFNLDFDGLAVRSIKVDGEPAHWDRDGGELIVWPRRGLRDGSVFTIVVGYDGVPETIDELGTSGFIHTDDGAVVAGEPHVASTWFPVNDHPIDKAAYTIKLTVPRGLEAVSNGVLQNRRHKGDWTTWIWQAQEPMASYLVTAAIGEFELNRYRADGIRYWDAIDTALFEPVATPRTGTQLAISQVGNSSYKRLVRTISVPAGGAQLSFWVTRDTEPAWDFLFVEAHTVGQDDWTTLPDANGHTSQDTGFSCPFWLNLHPFLTHYQTESSDGSCSPTGTSGTWWAVSGASDGFEQWSIDLSGSAGRDVEISISYASDDIMQHNGVFVDDIVVSTGAGTTSFEDDGDVLDGWTVPGAPTGSAANPNDWIAGTVADTPAPLGEHVQRSFARQPEIIAFLSRLFGSYPFSAAGGIVDDNDILGFALETQTRPIYSKRFFGDPLSEESVVVHELAHQWAGDSLTLTRWRHIWLNEGFATYAEWLWSEWEGFGSAEDISDFFYSAFPAEHEFWSVKVGDPGPDALFDFAVYARGAMTLHQLRVAVGEEDFFRILREWAESRAASNVTTAQFIRLAEQISGDELSELFDAWLFSTEKPVLSDADQVGAASAAAVRPAPAAARVLIKDAMRSGRRR